MIYTDFSKAFDRVPLDILMTKLAGIGVNAPLLYWMKSYLTNRMQYVQIGGAQSNTFIVSSGVSQGSHLGLLLFIVFISDVVEYLVHSRGLLFADDNKLFARIDSLQDAIHLQSDLNRLSDWCHRNRLPLNVQKCCCASYYRKKNPIEFNYNIEGCALKRGREMRDLGVVFNRELTFNPHVDTTVSRAYSVLGFVMKACKDVHEVRALKTLYCSLARSVLEYCSQVWSPLYAVHVARLESIQRKFTRYFQCKTTGQVDAYPTYLDLSATYALDTLEHRRLIALSMFL